MDQKLLIFGVASDKDSELVMLLYLKIFIPEGCKDFNIYEEKEERTYFLHLS